MPKYRCPDCGYEGEPVVKIGRTEYLHVCPNCNEAIGYERPMLLVEKTEPWHFSCYVEYIEAGGE